MQLARVSPSVWVHRLKSLKLGLTGRDPPAFGETPSLSLAETAFLRELTSDVISAAGGCFNCVLTRADRLVQMYCTHTDGQRNDLDIFFW